MHMYNNSFMTQKQLQQMDEVLKMDKIKKKKMNLNNNEIISNEDMEIIRETMKNNFYTLSEKLGEGGFGVVFKITSLVYNQPFAVKVFRQIEKCNMKKPESVDIERSTLMHLNHPNIIRLYNSLEDSKFHYLILEYCPNGSLKSLKAPLSLSQFKMIATQILQAVEFCHSHGFSHGDIKPANFLLDENCRVKLSDFGLSQQSLSNAQPLSKKYGGSRPFSAPEVIRCVPYEPMKADIWSLAITFYYLLTKRLPWGSPDITKDILTGMIQFPSSMDLTASRLIYYMANIKPDFRPDVKMVMQNTMFTNLVNSQCVGSSISLINTMNGEKQQPQKQKSSKHIVPLVNLTKLPLLSHEYLISSSRSNRTSSGQSRLTYSSRI